MVWSSVMCRRAAAVVRSGCGEGCAHIDEVRRLHLAKHLAVNLLVLESRDVHGQALLLQHAGHLVHVVLVHRAGPDEKASWAKTIGFG